MKIPKSCEVACVKKLKKNEKSAFVKAIKDEYRVRIYSLQHTIKHNTVEMDIYFFIIYIFIGTLDGW